MRRTNVLIRYTGLWISVALALSATSLSSVAYAEAGVWTRGGPYGGLFHALAIVPTTPRTWTGTNSGLWSDPANWGGAIPSSGDDLHFPEGAANASMTNDLGAAFLVGALSIESSTTRYTLAGNSITLGSGGLSVAAFSGSPHSLDTAVALGGGTSTLNVVGLLDITGIVSGAGGFTKTGHGTLRLTAANTYLGTTTQTGGILLVNGSQPASPITVNAPFFDGEGFWGTGTVGSVTVTSGFLNPPFGRLGVLTVVGAVTLTASAGMYPVIASPTVGTGCPLVNATGAVNLGGAALYPSLNPASTTGSVYTIVQAGGGVTGTFAGMSNGSTFGDTGRILRIDYLSNSVTLTDVGPGPTAVVSGTATICAGGSTPIQAVLTGTAPWNVTWSDSVVQSGVATSPATRNVSPSSTTTYTVTALTDANGAAWPPALTGSAVITVNPTPTTPNIAAPTSALPGATGLTASVPLDASVVAYWWFITNGTITAGNMTHQITFTAGSSGVTVLGVQEQTAAGCFSPGGSANVYIGADPAGLVEDAHATGGTISNVNSVLEPGETVLVNPSWKNISAVPLALTGTASAFNGPAGATYTLLDTAAGYGTIAPGATADSFTAGGPSYRLSVSNPVTRPAAHWDATFLETLSNGIAKTWTLHIGQSFSDVPTSNVSYAFVENIFHKGITTGCAAGLYCPAVELPRWQMAIFLARSILGPGVTIPTSGTVSGVGPYDCTGGISLFTDVAPTNVACPAIHFIYSQGITTGCGPGIYCPSTLLPRWQMAIFLARSMLGPGVPIPISGTVSGVGPYNCTGGGTSLFTDVPTTDVACPAVHYIYSQGVTTGCGAGIYCPNTLLPRWQMAIFLVRAFHMPFLH